MTKVIIAAIVAGAMAAAGGAIAQTNNQYKTNEDKGDVRKPAKGLGTYDGPAKQYQTREDQGDRSRVKPGKGTYAGPAKQYQTNEDDGERRRKGAQSTRAMDWKIIPAPEPVRPGTYRFSADEGQRGRVITGGRGSFYVDPNPQYRTNEDVGDRNRVKPGGKRSYDGPAKQFQTNEDEGEKRRK